MKFSFAGRMIPAAMISRAVAKLLRILFRQAVWGSIFFIRRFKTLCPIFSASSAPVSLLFTAVMIPDLA